MHRHTQLTENERSSMLQAANILADMKPNEPTCPADIGWFVFDMNRTTYRTVMPFIPNTKTLHRRECGTAGCLLGLAHLIECAAGRPNTWKPTGEDPGHMATPDVATTHPAYRVFYPDYDGYHNITPRMAGLAAICFLSGEDEPNYYNLEDTEL